ncbi:DUF4333 domain-containing protein [Cellulosimicrobium protaetiae]|uniref:DUF4333 domain-containing protein n=1 Tax=Cellulosimicrobium protaetiae TaxID=2587808 RepID=A0A6M5UKK0_9MICO|nr:DUF4333 domain-containing protein [Cellulosimicrobium protaetiae]QJW37229.1 DUF4333 domain-containing protein [Cellulosimicrobium protaetiae]
MPGQLVANPYETAPLITSVPQSTGWQPAPLLPYGAMAMAPQVAPRARVDNVAAWMLVGAPILWILASIVALQSGVSNTTLGMGLLLALVNTLLALWDIANVRRAGIAISTGMWITVFLFVPAYLIQRTLRSKQTWWIPALWVVVWIVSLAATPVISYLGGVEYDAQYVEEEIEADLAELYELPGAEVTCPDAAIAPVGSFFSCDVVYSDGSTETVNVDVLDWTGGWNWRI